MCKTSAIFKKKYRYQVVSRISAVFFTYHDNSAKPNISRIFFPAIRNLKKIRLGGLIDSIGLSSFRFVQWAPKDASFLQQSAF